VKYTYEQRRHIIAKAHETLARLRMAEAIDGLAEEQNQARRFFARERQRQNPPTGKRSGLIYKTIVNARLDRNGRRL
jgi:hypothetical protein